MIQPPTFLASRTGPMHFEFCSHAPIAKPVGLLDDVHADGDSDQGSDSTPAPAKPSAGGFVGRARNWILGMLSGVGFTGLGAR